MTIRFEWNELKNQRNIVVRGLDFVDAVELVEGLLDVKEKSMKRKSKTDWKRVDAMADEDIDYTDSPELDQEWFDNAVWGIPTKEIMTIRLDHDVLAWYKSSGPGYQTRINALLRAYMDAQIKKSANRASTKKVSASKAVKSRKRA